MLITIFFRKKKCCWSIKFLLLCVINKLIEKYFIELICTLLSRGCYVPSSSDIWFFTDIWRRRFRDPIYSHIVFIFIEVRPVRAGILIRGQPSDLLTIRLLPTDEINGLIFSAKSSNLRRTRWWGISNKNIFN